MARLFTCGFETNSLTAGIEWTTIQSTPSIQTSVVRSGTYALQINSLGSTSVKGVRYQFSSSAANGPYYARVYFRVATLPTGANQVIQFTNGTTLVAGIELNADGTLQLRDEDGTIGSPSAALSLNTWYAVELLIDTTGAGGAHVVTARLDHVNFATASNRNLSTGVNIFRIGGNLAAEAQTTGDWFFDDCAVNDTVGSFQNSWPGSGKIIMLVPTAAGDANAWLNTAGGAGSSNNFQLVDEIPPNDGTDLVQSNTLNAVDMYNFTNTTIGFTDTINMVSLMVRMRNNTADAVTSFRIRMEKAAAGAVSESADIIPNSATWRTNDPGAVKTSPLTLYQDPDAANWSKTTIDSMQAGVKLTAAGTNNVQVSALYAMLDYTPDPNPPKGGTLTMMGV